MYTDRQKVNDSTGLANIKREKMKMLKNAPARENCLSWNF